MALHWIDPIPDTVRRLPFLDLFDIRGVGSGRARMHQIELLVEAYLKIERDLVAAVDAAGGTVPLSDGWSCVKQEIPPIALCRFPGPGHILHLASCAPTRPGAASRP